MFKIRPRNKYELIVHLKGLAAGKIPIPIKTEIALNMIVSFLDDGDIAMTLWELGIQGGLSQGVREGIGKPAQKE